MYECSGCKSRCYLPNPLLDRSTVLGKKLLVRTEYPQGTYPVEWEPEEKWRARTRLADEAAARNARKGGKSKGKGKDKGKGKGKDKGEGRDKDMGEGDGVNKPPGIHPPVSRPQTPSKDASTSASSSAFQSGMSSRPPVLPTASDEIVRSESLPTTMASPSPIFIRIPARNLSHSRSASQIGDPPLPPNRPENQRRKRLPVQTPESEAMRKKRR